MEKIVAIVGTIVAAVMVVAYPAGVGYLNPHGVVLFGVDTLPAAQVGGAVFFASMAVFFGFIAAKA